MNFGDTPKLKNFDKGHGPLCFAREHYDQKQKLRQIF